MAWNVCGCWSWVAQSTCGGAIGNDWSEHCCTSAVVTNGTSGSPVMAPVESGQLRMFSTDVRNTDEVPTIATSFWHASIWALVVAFGFSFES